MSWIVEERLSAWCYAAMGAMGIGMAVLLLSGCAGVQGFAFLASASIGSTLALLGTAVVAAGVAMLPPTAR